MTETNQTETEEKVIDILVELKTNDNDLNITRITDEIEELEFNKVYRVDPNETSFALNFFESNRDVRQNNLLKRSILKDGIITPILVNDKLEIIDGQHRYSIAIKNNIPYDFIIRDIGNDIAETIMDINNSQMSWNITDIVSHFAKEGNEEYQKLYTYMENYNDLVSRSMITKLAAGLWPLSVTKHEVYKQGSYETYKKSMEDFYVVLKDISVELNFKPRRHFVVALYAMWAYRNFDLNRLKRKLKSMPNSSKEIEAWNSISDAYVLFTNLVIRYNSGLNENSRIALKTLTGKHPAGEALTYKPDKRLLDPEKVKID